MKTSLMLVFRALGVKYVCTWVQKVFGPLGRRQQVPVGLFRMLFWHLILMMRSCARPLQVSS